MTKSRDTTTAQGLVDVYQAKLGERVVSVGAEHEDTERIPTGLFELDLALGGGFPKGRPSIIFGPESSAKTSIMLKAMASHQRIWPHEVCVFVDLEHAFDPDWARKMGVDVDRLVVVRPGYAEQAVDMIESFMYADDVGFVGVDSLAAMVTAQELESSADKAQPGGASIVVGKLCRKAAQALQQAWKDDRHLTVCYINQVRMKVGVMFGSPEVLPGGNAQLFHSHLTLRVYGKNEVDESVSKVIPVKKAVTFVIKKWKVPIYSVSGKCKIVTYAPDGVGVGRSDDWETVLSYMRELGMIEKSNKRWKMLGEEYPRLSDCRDAVLSDRDLEERIKREIVRRVTEVSDETPTG